MNRISRRRFNSLLASVPVAAMASSALNGWSQAAPPPAASGPYQPNWASISTHAVPTWYTDARFGISMHWGLYSVPAHQSEWYFKHMYGDKAISPWHAE